MKKFIKNQAVIVKTREGQIEGIITGSDVNFCTYRTEYSVDYQKNGRTWTMIGIPETAIELK